jgi:DNA-binding MarR family transcriptional regulator
VSLPASTTFDHEILTSIRRILTAVDQHSKYLARSHGITVSEFTCLTTLATEGTMTVEDLREALCLSPGVVAGLLASLERKGYVMQKRHSPGSVGTRVEITVSGRAITSQTPGSPQISLVEGLHHFPDDEKLAMLAALRRVLDLMKVGEANAAPILDVGPLS